MEKYQIDSTNAFEQEPESVFKEFATFNEILLILSFQISFMHFIILAQNGHKKSLNMFFFTNLRNSIGKYHIFPQFKNKQDKM